MPKAIIHKMSKNSRTNKKLKRKPLRRSDDLTHKLFAAVVLASVFIVVVFMYKFVAFQMKPISETPRGEVLKIPSGIEKKLKKDAAASASFRVPILLYHYVEYVKDKKDTIRQSLNITPNIFEEQVKTLSDAGYTFITAKELGEVLDGKTNLPKKPILLTFDDGHWDLDTDVLPILKKYKAKGTAYIIPGFIGGSDFLSYNQLQDVVSSKLLEIGAHTVHHISLKGKFLPIVQYEVGQSKSMLEKAYHFSVVSFAYPGGAFDEQAIKVVKDSGFSTAVSTVPGIAQGSANRFFLFRLRPGYRIGDELLNYINQTYFPVYFPLKS